MGFFQRHQLAEVTFVRVVPVRYAGLWFLQRSPRVVDRHGVVRTASTGFLQVGEAVAVFNGFQTVVDAVAATDWNEAVQDVVQVSGRDFIDREVTAINAPLREVGGNHFIGMFCEGFVVFLQRRIQRQEVATVSIRHDDQLACAFGTAAVVTEFNLLLVATAFFHFKGGRTGCTGSTGPDGLAIQQHFTGGRRVAAPDVPLDFYVDTVVMNLNKITVVHYGLVHFNDGKFIVTAAD